MNRNLENGVISASQLKFSVIFYLQTSVLITSFYMSVTKQDSWIMIFSGMFVSLPFIGIYLYLANQFPKKNFIQIINLVLGKFLGKIFSLLYLFYFMTIATLNLRDLGNFATSLLIPGTPMTVTLIPFIFICAWAVYKGIETITRYTSIFTFLCLIILILSIILLIPKFNLNNFLPAFSLPFTTYIQGTHIASAVTFNELITFLFVIPCVREQNLIKKSFLSGYFIGTAILFLLISNDIAVLGNFGSIFIVPNYESLRIINVAKILSRMEIIFIILRSILIFFRINIFYYAAVICIAQIFELRTYKPIVFITGAIMLSYSLFIFHSPGENIIWGKDSGSFFNTFFQILLPLIIFITLIIKKKIKNGKDNKHTDSA